MQTRPPRGDGDSSSPRAQHVLIVDDEPIIRELLAEHLADEGFSVACAESIERARASIAQHAPDLILLDLMLPNNSGWDFLRDRRDDPPLAAIPVVVLSAATPERIGLAADLGADECLRKPFDLEMLTRLMRSRL